MSGPLMAIYLARRGFEVEVYERRGDQRREPVTAAKSIKLTLAERGLSALSEVGLAEHVKATCCIPLYGRAVHREDGNIASIPYGKNRQEVIHSFSRTDLNKVLLDKAESYGNIRLFFHHRCQEIDRDTAAATFLDLRQGQVRRVEADAIIGADGAYSTVRQQIQRGQRADFDQRFLAWGYKELAIAAAHDGGHQMDRHALHIWPRGDHMLFALPNLDGSFNAVCVLPFSGPASFESLAGEGDVRQFFRRYFPDALPLMPRLGEEFARCPVSSFLTIRTSLWHHRGKAVLIGDACHAVVPFYGQGMNAAFEDCSVLDQSLARHPDDWHAAFSEYQALRVRNTDALAELSVQNFHELRDTVRRPIIAARKRTGIALNRLLRKSALPIYTMVSHTNIPYAECVERARRQDRVARWLGLDLVVWLVSLAVYARRRLLRRQAPWQAAPAAPPPHPQAYDRPSGAAQSWSEVESGGLVNEESLAGQ
jgi:kynurenine 3-monooxygenase